MQILDTGVSKGDFIYTLHGFLGQADDWSALFSEWNNLDQIVSPSYFSDPGFESLSIENFYQHIQNCLVDNYDKKVFIGYSLGGRIGLKILEQYPDLFDQYIFISTHVGLSDSHLKQTRLDNDKHWAHKLQQQPWEQFIGDWNQQEVLKSTVAPTRLEHDFDKQRLICSLDLWSLGAQQNYSDIIRKHQNKISWVVGQEDTKFLNLSEELMQKKILLSYQRISSGHRILFENPASMQKVLKQLLQNLD